MQYSRRPITRTVAETQNGSSYFKSDPFIDPSGPCKTAPTFVHIGCFCELGLSVVRKDDELGAQVFDMLLESV